MTDADPFGDAFDEGVPRDGRGRPLIIPATRGKPNPKGKLVPYTRASTFADALSAGGPALTRWKLRHAAVGIAIRPDLAAMVAAMGRNVNDYSDADKSNLDAIIETAHDASGGNDKANYGTAVHSMTEPGRDPFAVDVRMVADAAAYDALLDVLDAEVVDTETFTVNDELQVAGTFDHTIRLRSDLVVDDNLTLPAGTVLVIDKKTGTLHLDQHGIQLAVYARGKKYDHVTGERAALDVSPQWGIVVHIPRAEGKAVAYLVDLHAGWKAAKLAGEARVYTSAANKRKLARVVAEASAPVEVVEASAPVEVVEPATTPDPFDTPAPVAVVDVDDAAQGGPVVEGDDTVPIGPDGFPVEPTVGDAIANLNAAGMLDKDQPDAIMHAIEQAATADALHAVWRKYKAAWTPAYTEAAKRRSAKLAAA